MSDVQNAVQLLSDAESAYNQRVTDLVLAIKSENQQRLDFVKQTLDSSLECYKTALAQIISEYDRQRKELLAQLVLEIERINNSPVSINASLQIPKSNGNGSVHPPQNVR